MRLSLRVKRLSIEAICCFTFVLEGHIVRLDAMTDGLDTTANDIGLGSFVSYWLNFLSFLDIRQILR